MAPANMSEKAHKRSNSDFDDITVTPPSANIDGEGHVDGTGQHAHPIGSSNPNKDVDGSSGPTGRVHYEEAPGAGPTTWYAKTWKVFKTPGSALQIVVGAVIAIAIGMGVNVAVDDVPEAAIIILGIPGRLWLRALTAVVLPLIITAMILAMQRLKDMSRGGSVLAKWSITYYACTTVFAIAHSILMTALVWRNLMVEVDEGTLTSDPGTQATDIQESGDDLSVPQVVQTVFDSFITNNIVNSLATNDLLAVLIVAVVVGCLIIGPSSRSPLLALVKEIDRIITIVITFLIKLAPIAVFSLILSNIMRLDLASVGQNLGVLIGAALSGFAIHLFIVFPIIFYAITRMNPYSYWLSGSPAWITAWGTASSAATLPVTMRVVRKQGIPPVVAKFTVPLGCLVNMDGTAIYFPVVVTFMAATQGITLNAGDYIIVLLLSTLASIGATPIPSSSLVLTVMICGTVGVPITGMYAVVVAIDWFLDRFRTALNISSDLFAARIVTVLSRIDDDGREDNVDEDQMVQDAVEDYNREVRGDRL